MFTPTQERDEQDQLVLDQKMNGLRMSHTRRTAAMEAGQAARVTALEEKCALEIDELRANQKKEYDILASVLTPRDIEENGSVYSLGCVVVLVLHALVLVLERPGS